MVSARLLQQSLWLQPLRPASHVGCAEPTFFCTVNQFCNQCSNLSLKGKPASTEAILHPNFCGRYHFWGPGVKAYR